VQSLGGFLFASDESPNLVGLNLAALNPFGKLHPELSAAHADEQEQVADCVPGNAGQPRDGSDAATFKQHLEHRNALVERQAQVAKGLRLFFNPRLTAQQTAEALIALAVTAKLLDRLVVTGGTDHRGVAFDCGSR
jgi:hypothetical protein